MKKLKITARWYYRSYLPTIILLWLLGLMLLNSGCKKDTWVQSPHILDTSFYFILNLNGKTYNSAAWKARNSTFEYAPSISGIFANKPDPAGAPVNWNLTIISEAETNFRFVTSTTNPMANQIASTFSSKISIYKKGDLLGQYQINDSVENKFSDVTGKNYRIDAASSHFTLTGMDQPTTSNPYIDGNFECIVYEVNGIDGTPIHVSGTFRLKAF